MNPSYLYKKLHQCSEETEESPKARQKSVPPDQTEGLVAGQKKRRMGTYDDMVGVNFKNLLVLSISRSKGNRAKVVCQCKCGNKVTTEAERVRSGNTRSCGCLSNKDARSLRGTKHGFRHHPLYKTWRNILHRYYNSNVKCFRYYGARGIGVSDEWRFGVDGKHPFSVFLEDMGNKPAGASVERIDNNLGYSKENCKWATKTEQSRNTRKTIWVHLPGESLILKDFCDLYGFQRSTLPQRAKRLGISILDAAKQMYDYKHK